MGHLSKQGPEGNAYLAACPKCSSQTPRHRSQTGRHLNHQRGQGNTETMQTISAETDHLHPNRSHGCLQINQSRANSFNMDELHPEDIEICVEEVHMNKVQGNNIHEPPLTTGNLQNPNFLDSSHLHHNPLCSDSILGPDQNHLNRKNINTIHMDILGTDPDQFPPPPDDVLQDSTICENDSPDTPGIEV